MMKASPGAMPAPNASMTAAVEAGKAPMWSGNTTCCATTSPRAFISAQDASCDSRTMVEKPVRNSEFCISCTMPERLAFTTSRSTGSMARMGSALLRQDQVLPVVHPRDLPGADNGRAIELLEDRRARDVCTHIDLVALIDRTLELRSIEAHAPAAPPCVCKRRTRAREFRRLYMRQEPEAAHPVGHDLDRLLRRHMAEGALGPLIKAHAQLFEIARPQRFGRAGHRDLVALAGVAHVERPLDADTIGRKTITAQLRKRLRYQLVEDVIHLFGRDFGQRRQFRTDVV